jgi:histone acetyltransferase SAS3
MGRGNASAFDHGPPLNTVAPRDEDEDSESPEGSKLSNNGKRDFDTFNGTNGDTEGITEGLGKLTTANGEIVTTEGGSGRKSSTPKLNGAAKKLSWYEQAGSIPATRFEVYPPLPGARNRTVSRPSVSRSAPRPRSSLSTPSRPKPKRSSESSSRRSSAARPRSSTSRRKSGGTGRGPGRWPKGTKKTDFGGAESAPGLPPKLLKRRSKLGNEVLLGDEEGEEADEDEEEEKNGSGEQEEEEEDEEAIVYEKPLSRTRGSRDSSRGQGLGKPTIPTGKGKGVGLGKPLFGNGKFGKSVLVAEAEDEEMEEAVEEDVEEDADADMDNDEEGEDE